MQIKKITLLIEETGVKSIFLFCHHNADLDSFCSAYAFGRLLSRINPDLNVSIVTPGGLGRLSKYVAEKLRISVAEKPDISVADVVVLLDVNTFKQLDDWEERIKNLSIPVLLIDHHRIHPETEGQVACMIVDEEATSTAEIIYRLWKDSKFKLDRQEAMAIFLGIVYDTRRLALSNSGTFRIIMDLIECGVDVQEAFKLISVPMELSERIARLKAVKRAKIHRIDQWVVAVSKISTFQASAARALIGVGADVSIVGGVKDDELRVSLRSTRDFFEKTNIHLGRDLATPLGKEIGGAGGGHSTSAGANGKGDPRICLSKCLDLFRDKLTANQSVG